MHDLVSLSENQGAVSKNAQASHSSLSQLSAVSLSLEVFDPVMGQGHSSQASFRIKGGTSKILAFKLKMIHHLPASDPELTAAPERHSTSAFLWGN